MNGTQTTKYLVVVAVIAAAALGFFFWPKTTDLTPSPPPPPPPAQITGDVIVETPKNGALVQSPLLVKGKARGNWFFEANLPVTLKDQNGKALAQKGFQAKGEWMTTDYVEFEDTLVFANPETEYGLLVIQNDNASGLPEFDKSFVVPVKFK